MNGYEMTVEERREYLFTKLTDGSYTQGYCQLRERGNGEGFRHCCLGVACDVFLKLTGEGEWCDVTLFRVGGESKDVIMPKKVAGFFGFNNPKGEYIDVDGCPYALTIDNDNEVPFSGIVETMRNPGCHVFK